MKPNQGTPSQVSFLRLYFYASPATLCLAALGICCGLLTGVLWPFLFTKIGDAYMAMQHPWAGANEFYENTLNVSKWMGAMALVCLVVGYVGVLAAVSSARRVADDLRNRYLRSILSQNLRWVDKHNPLTLPGQMHSDCLKIEAALGEKLHTFCNVSSYLVVAFSSALLVCPQLMLAGLLPSPLVCVGMVLVGYTMTRKEVLKREAYAQAGSIAEESLAEYKTIAAHCAETSRLAAYTQSLESSRSVASRLSMLFGLGWGMLISLWFIISALVFWFGGILISQHKDGWIRGNEIGVREEIIVFLTIGTTFLYVGNLVPCYQAIIEGRVAAHRAFSVIRKAHFMPNGSVKPQIQGKLTFENVYFQYNSGKGIPVLAGLNFTAEAGKVTALVGESGAGKSTVAQLIERFYDPLIGRVLVDQTDLRDLDVEYWRQNVGLVSQEPILFNTTIYENIALGSKNATAGDVFEAAALSSSMHFIKSLELGFHTEVGVKGRLLSGGQKQRIAIARALVRNPAILILDEATSSLDNKSEAEVQDALDKLLAQKHFTTIVIAQRLSTVKGADKIIVLSQGKKIEEGSHDSLLSTGGVYSVLVRGQTASHSSHDPSGAAIMYTAEASTVDMEISAPSDPQGSTSLFSRLLRLTSTQKCALFLGCVAAALGGMNYPVYGYLMSKQIDYTVVKQGDEMVRNCKILAWIVAGVSLGALGFTTLMSTSLGKVTANVTSTLRHSTFRSLLYHEAAFHDQKSHSPQTLTQTLERDCESVSAAGGPAIGAFLMLVSAIVIGSGIGIYHSSKLGTLVTGLTPLLFFGLVRGYLMHGEGKPRQEVDAANAFLADSIANIRTVHAYSISTDLQHRYQLQLAAISQSSSLRSHLSAFTLALSASMVYVVFAVAFWYGAKLVRDEGLDYQSECISVFSPFMGAMGVTVAVVFSPDVSAGSKAIKRLFGFIEYKSAFSAADSGGLKPKISGSIEFRDVTFAYPSKSSPTLQGVSFKVPFGSSLGITGSSGSGKSTIVQLLLRFYDPIAGEIFIDGVGLRHLNLKHLRQAIALVGQEPVLFSGSVRENVLLGKEEYAKDEEVMSALEEAQAADFVTGHPLGLDRNVGIRGSSLSGGQKQRIAIARALFRRPKVLILDEATSALDTNTERLVQQTLSARKDERTCIIVAHRLCTIATCDQILVIDSGRVREVGTHAELMRKEGSIYAMQTTQSEKRCRVN